MRALYRIVRELTSSRSSSSEPVKSKDGEALLSDEEQDARWVEDFKEVLNQRTPPMLFSFDRETPAPTPSVALDEISRTQVTKTIKSLKNNKTLRLNEVTGELLN